MVFTILRNINSSVSANRILLNHTYRYLSPQAFNGYGHCGAIWNQKSTLGNITNNSQTALSLHANFAALQFSRTHIGAQNRHCESVVEVVPVNPPVALPAVFVAGAQRLETLMITELVLRQGTVWFHVQIRLLKETNVIVNLSFIAGTAEETLLNNRSGCGDEKLGGTETFRINSHHRRIPQTERYPVPEPVF